MDPFTGCNSGGWIGEGAQRNVLLQATRSTDKHVLAALPLSVIVLYTSGSSYIRSLGIAICYMVGTISRAIERAHIRTTGRVWTCEPKQLVDVVYVKWWATH